MHKDPVSKNLPEWAKGLLSHIQLTAYQIERLELIRDHSGISHQEFHFHIQSHPECTKKLQRTLFARLKAEDPSVPDEIVLVHLVYSRLLTAGAQGMRLFGIRSQADDHENPPPELLAAIFALVRDRGWRTVNDFADALVREEATLPGNTQPAPEMREVARQIALVLAERSEP